MTIRTAVALLAVAALPAAAQAGAGGVGSGLDSLGGVLWAFETEGPVRGSPTLADGVVYIGGTDGRLYALDARDGRERWRYDAGAPVGGAPLVLGDRVVVAARGNTVHAVERATGRPLWTRETGPDLPLAWGHEGWDYLLPSAVAAGDDVLFGSGDGHLYALDPADGSVRWRFATGGRIRAAPAVHDGVAYVGSGDGIVYGVDLAEGREVWRFRTAGADLDAADFGFDRTQIQATPVILDGTLYLGSRDANFYAIDLASGEVRWTGEDGTAWVVNTAAVTDDRVFVGRSSGGRFRAHDRESGEELWTHATGGLVFSSPVVVGRTVYVGSGDHGVHALDVATGARRWRFATGGMVVSSPAVDGGRLYVGSDDGTVYALHAAEGPAPRRAVYWDDDHAPRAFFGSQPAHRRLAEHFESRGYERLDAAGLIGFLTERIADRAPSVVVFGLDATPDEVVDPAAPSASLLRRYLDAGGKVVWPGAPPLALERNADGQIVGLSRAGPEAVLGVNHHGWDTDLYPVTVTDAGRRWGLRTDWVGSPSVDADQAGTVLAIDETGRASAWVRSFGGPEGTGYVVVPPTLDPRRLEEMRAVAEYGIFRASGRQGSSR